jgi:lipopolysaccharide export system protein LptA
MKTQSCFRSRGLAASLVLASCCVATLALAQGRRNSPVIPGGNSRAPISIDAEKLEYLEKEQKFIYSGNVVAKQGDASIRAPTITVFLEKDAAKKPPGQGQEGGMNEQIKRIEACCKVVVNSKDQVGTGDRGVYDKENNKVFLYGNPVLTQGPNVVRGGPDGVLEYDLNTGRANIRGRVQSIFTPGSDEKKSGAAGRKPGQ